MFLVFVLWGVTLMTFFLARVAPADPARLIAGAHADAPLLAIGGLSMPAFWLAMLFQLIFYSRLGWLPFGGRLDTGTVPPPHLTGLITVDALLTGRVGTFFEALQHLALPVITLALAEI